MLGGTYHDQRKSKDRDDGINYQAKSVVSLAKYYGVASTRAIMLRDCDINDNNDTSYLTSNLSGFNLNLELFDISLNQLTGHGVQSIMSGLRNITTLNLSDNHIDDAGAKILADAIESGTIPSTKCLNISGNHITITGEGYLTNAIRGIHAKNIAIILTVKNSLAETKEFFKTALKYYAQEFHLNQVAVDAETQKYITDCQKTGINVALGGLGGIMKCSPSLTLGYSGLGQFFYCLTKEIGISLLQPETLSCLADFNRLFEQDSISVIGASNDQDMHHENCVVM